jgi:hypothetical protein
MIPQTSEISDQLTGLIDEQYYIRTRQIFKCAFHILPLLIAADNSHSGQSWLTSYQTTEQLFSRISNFFAKGLS